MNASIFKSAVFSSVLGLVLFSTGCDLFGEKGAQSTGSNSVAASKSSNASKDSNFLNFPGNSGGGNNNSISIPSSPEAPTKQGVVAVADFYTAPRKLAEALGTTLDGPAMKAVLADATENLPASNKVKDFSSTVSFAYEKIAVAACSDSAVEASGLLRPLIPAGAKNTSPVVWQGVKSFLASSFWGKAAPDQTESDLLDAAIKEFGDEAGATNLKIAIALCVVASQTYDAIVQ